MFDTSIICSRTCVYRRGIGLSKTMRASQLVAFAVSVTTVSTFGIRGAAER